MLVPAAAADPPSRRERIAQTVLGARSAAEPWSDYEIIYWQPQTARRLAGLVRLGVTAGKIFGERSRLDPTRIPEKTAPFRALGLRWYIENIATDFYASYHRWHPEHPLTWLFEESKRLHREEPESLAALVRTPSLSDPVWLRRIAQRLQQHVRAYAPYRPLFYSLADEAGIADLSAAWDFDFAPESLAGMRSWLRQRYGRLAALNREWGTRFPAWNAVMPMTTDAALQRSGENFAAWADFKEWMDVAFARAVRAGTDAVHAADPQARAALEGAQIPGWGGYDYSRLGGAVDIIEMYDSGNNLEIAHSLFPGLIPLMTSSLAGSEELHAIWHGLLLGGRGVILWDEDNALVDEDGAPTSRGRSLRALAHELHSELAAQLIASTAATDPVAILYSPASFRIQWLLDRKVDGKPWADRRSETEGEDNPVRAAMRRASGMLTHLGVQPRWLTSAMIEQGELQSAHLRVLVLPHAIALSPRAAEEIRKFAAAGGVVLADSEPGLFDAHGRRLAQPLLADVTGADGPVTLVRELGQDAVPGDPTPLLRLREMLEKAGVRPRFTLSAPDGAVAANIDARAFRNGDVTIIGLQQDWDNAAANVNQDIVLGFGTPVYAYDLRQPGPPQHAERIRLTLDAVAPALVAVTSAPLPEFSISGPTKTRPGVAAKFTITPNRVGAAAAARIVHVEAIAPDGTEMAPYATNLAVRAEGTVWQLPLTVNDPTGTWTVRIVDALSGKKAECTIAVISAAVAPQ